MDTDTIKNLMSEISQFDELDHEEVNLLASLLEYKQEKTGSIVIKEGQVGNSLYYITNGKVEISVESMSGETPAIVGRIKGDTIGEMAVLGFSDIRSATATALSDTTLLRLSKKNYERLIDEYPKTANKILMSITANLCQRIKELSHHVADSL